MPLISFKLRGPSKKYFELLKNRFEEKRRKWNLSYGINFNDPKYDLERGKTSFVFKKENDEDPGHMLYIPSLFLSGLAPEINERIVSGKRFNSLSINMSPEYRWSMYPIYAGVITEAKRKGANYSIAHIPLKGIVNLALDYKKNKVVSCKKTRTFVFLPDPLHAENFALASVHSEGTFIRSQLPFAVGYLRAIEHNGFVLLENLQANFSRRKVEENSTLVAKDQIISNKIDDYYSHWKRIVLKHALEFYLKRGKKVIFPDLVQYNHIHLNYQCAVSGIEKDVEKAAEFHGCTARELTEKELKKFKLEGAVGKFKIIERKE